MSEVIHPAQESGRQDALFDWVWKKDDRHYERERLARYRHAAGKAVSGENTGWNREKPVKDKPSRHRRAVAANALRDRTAHAASCRIVHGRAKYTTIRYNTLLASRGNSM